MKITERLLGELKPYENNPRKNDQAVDAVAASIREFGFKVPIIVDRNDEIVCGHTRYKAAAKLGLQRVPVITADDLTDEQVKAFRLADNKVAEQASWDIDKLLEEIDSIATIDMEEFGFEFPEEPDTGYYGDEREKTYNAYNLQEYDDTRTEGFYQMPVIEACDYVPEELIGFNYMLSTKRRDTGIHFFVDDYQFERVWNSPMEYIPKLAEFECCLTPDFSLYMDMPMAMKVWNVYRSRLIGQMLQDAGAKVIPTLSWAEKETFSFCFDGIRPGGTVAVSTVGVMRDKEAQQIWKAGMDEAIRRIRPKTVLCYGTRIDYDFGNTPVKYIEARKGWQ